MITRATGVFWDSTVKLPDWLVVPPEADEQWRTAATTFVRESLLEASADTPEAVGHTELLALDAVTRLQEFADGIDANVRVIAAVGVAGRTPVPVLVTVLPHVPARDLMSFCGARGAGVFGPPNVEHFEIDGNDALRVTRVDGDEDRVVWVSVTTGLRTDLGDIIVMWRGTDLDLVPYMVDLVDELAASIQIEEDAE